MSNMNHESIEHLLAEMITTGGIPENTIKAFTNVIKGQGYVEPVKGNRQFPQHVDQLVSGLYACRGDKSFDCLAHVRLGTLTGKFEYKYIHHGNTEGITYSPALSSFLKNEKWELVIRF